MLLYLGQLAKDFIQKLPIRCGRALRYFLEGTKDLLSLNVQVRLIPWWWFGGLLLILDLLGIVELYEGLSALSKREIRPLRKEEIAQAQSIFADTINYRRVRIDGRAWLGPKQYQFCYVSFYTINSWGTMRNDTLIHELVHVWQYERFGALYIAKALLAQRAEGYDYGGWTELAQVSRAGGKLSAFNFEQQADIVMAYYRLQNGHPPRWGTATLQDISEYEYFIDQLVKLG